MKWPFIKNEIFSGHAGFSKDGIIHLRERGLQKASDSEVIALAQTEERIVLTMDLDFSHLAVLGQFTSPSLIIFRLANETPENVNRLLGLYLNQIQSVLKKGVIVIFEQTKIRIHSLPIIS